jgi:hypothetical protein
MRQEQLETKRAEALRIARAVRGPISRRGLLELAGWSGLAALVAGATGCASCCDRGGKDVGAGNNGPGEAELANEVQPGQDGTAVTWEEGVTAVEQFSQETGITLSEERGIHGIRLMVSEHKKFMEVVILPDKSVPEMPNHFTYTYGGGPNHVRVVHRKAPIGKAEVRVGHTAQGENLPVGMGSVGWNIRLNSACVAVSCFHVLCTNGNNTQPNVDRVLLNGTLNAKIRCFQVLQTGQTAPDNDWDLALADYNDDKDCVGYYTKCSTNGPYPTWAYPMSLAPVSGSNQPVANTTNNASMYRYHKVGAASPICASGGILKSTGARVAIRLPDGAWANFRGALVFTKMTNPGDSGCVIVRDSDDAVVGLHFGGSDIESFSNPLYRIPWIKNEANYLVPPDPANQQASTWIPQFSVAAGNNRCC